MIEEKNPYNDIDLTQTGLHFELLVQSVKDYAIFMLDTNGKILTWNEGAKKIKGYQADEIIGKHFSVFYTQPDQQKEEANRNLYKATQLGSYETEGWRIRKDGTQFWANVVFTALYDNQKQIKGFAKVTRDMTETKAWEDNLEQKIKLRTAELENILAQKIKVEEKVASLNNEISLSEKRFRALIENTGSVISLVDKDFNVIYRSPSSDKISGWSTEELKRISNIELVHRDDREQFLNCFIEALKHPNKIYNISCRSLHKNGNYIWLEGTVINLLNDETVKGLVINMRDVTERKTAEEKLKRSLKETLDYKKALDASDIVSITDAHENIIYVNDNFCNISQYTREELIGQKHRIVNSGFHSKEFMELLRSTIKSGQVYKGEFKNKAKDGTTYWVYNTIVAFTDENNIPYQYVSIATDITNRKQAEESLKQSEAIYKTIASSIPGSVIVMLDKNLKYLLVEGDLLEKIGYTKEQILGKTAIEVLPPERYVEFRLLFERAFKGEAFSVETKRLDFDLLNRYVPLINQNGQVEAIMLVMLDVTELKQAQRNVELLNESLEEKVEERTAQLKSAHAEMEAFTYTVSHDLRAPLRIIDGYTEILRDEFGNDWDKEAARLFNVIQTSAKRMGQLIDDLLQFSRTARKDLELWPIDMNILTQSIIRDQLLLQNENIKIEIDDLLPANADRVLIQLVWANLISNAIKYSSKSESPHIIIKSNKNENEIIYSVQDNGAGFDMKYANKLFGMFQRLHKDKEFEGTGVGLAIVQRIVLKHNGRVWAEGAIGKGATFYFSLPT